MIPQFIKRKITQRNISTYRKEAEVIKHYASMIGKTKKLSIEDSFRALANRDDRDSLLIGYAFIYERCQSVLGLTPYDEQLIGALALNDGKIIEMATGEGKTLTASFALAWRGNHKRAYAITVNDYLAKRDAEYLEPLYESLGLSVSYITDQSWQHSRAIAYRANIVYATPSQFVFDYLRDQTVYSVDALVQQHTDYILIDEADSVLIDEARTPMVLSGEGPLDDALLHEIGEFVDTLSHEVMVDSNITQIEKLMMGVSDISSDIGLDLKSRGCLISEKGTAAFENFNLSKGWTRKSEDLWQPANSHLWRAFNASIKARLLYTRDIDYIVRDDKVLIVESETGRIAHGKRWSEGIHQAIEAKEGITIRPETVEIGRIALANYLSKFPSVAGMTGTAMTVSSEFKEMYGLSTMEIPTHLPCIRNHHNDAMFMTRLTKWKQILEDVKLINEKGQPVLIGTSSVSDSESLSDMFTQAGLSHQILNAKHDVNEAMTIADAGKPYAITIATSMAGRGTDIILGGNDEDNNLKRHQVIDCGGLFVIGAERLDSRRLDLQLQGRSARQGDPGEAKFYVSMEDPLMRDFGAGKMGTIFKTMGLGEYDSVEHRMVDKAIANAQKMKQSLYMDARRDGLRQDSVLNTPREVIYDLRSEILHGDYDSDIIILKNHIASAAKRLTNVYLNGGNGFNETWDIESFRFKINQWHLDLSWFDALYDNLINNVWDVSRFTSEIEKWLDVVISHELKNLQSVDSAAVKSCMLMAVDKTWRDMLDDAENVRTGIHLRAFAQEKPLRALEKEVFKLFERATQELPVMILDYLFTSIYHGKDTADE